MARAILLTGTAGGIIGALTGLIGIIWSNTDMQLLAEVYTTYIYMFFTPLIFLFAVLDIPLMYFLGLILTPSFGLWTMLSWILAILILVSSILIGIGFFGIYKAGGRIMGALGLAFGIVGGVAGSILLILGNVLAPVIMSAPSFGVPVKQPLYLFIFLGFAIMGVSFIVIGSASIIVRGSTAYPSAAAAAGILSIIGGCLLFPYVLNVSLVPNIGGVIVRIGWVLLLSAFVIWAAVFYGSRKV